MKIAVTGYIYHKEAESYSDCYDRYGLNKMANKFAISDGVTSSFFPGIWADLLISEFIDKKEKINISDAGYLNSIQRIWFEKVKQIAENSSKWVQRKNFNDRRAALATFVGLHFFCENEIWSWEASALGDSFLFFVPATLNNFSFGENESSVQYLSSKLNFEFDNYPDYFSSYNSGKGEVQIKKGLLNSGSFLLMTDALSEWFINEKEEAFKLITSWHTHSDFIKSIDKLRSENRLHNDDSAILIINILNDGLQEINYQETQLDNIAELTKTENQEEEERKKEEEKTSIIEIPLLPIPTEKEEISVVTQILPDIETSKASPGKVEEKFVHRLMRLALEKKNRKIAFAETKKKEIKGKVIVEVPEVKDKNEIGSTSKINVSTPFLAVAKKEKEDEGNIPKTIINKF